MALKEIKTKMDAAREVYPLICDCEGRRKLATIAKKIVKKTDCWKCYSHNDYTIPFFVEQ